MGFQEAVRRCFGSYVTFSGRARRSEYWWFVLFVVIGGVIFSMVDAMVFGNTPEPGAAQSSPLASLFQLAVLLPLFAVAWRRLHDTGRPGWYVLIPMMISIGFVFAMLFGVMTFSAFETAGADQEALRGSATFLGVSGMIFAGCVQLVVGILMLWWLTRPSDIGENDYGPEPQ